MMLTNIKPTKADTLTKTFTSLTYDGDIFAYDYDYMSARYLAYGTVEDANTSIWLGQYKNPSLYYIHRAYLFFNTSIIPTYANITSATLSLYINIARLDTNFTVVIQKNKDTYPECPHTPLISEDYGLQQYYGDGGNRSTTTISGSGWWNITLNPTGLSWINKGGLTKFILRSNLDIYAEPPANDSYITFFSAEMGESYAPKLYITCAPTIGEFQAPSTVYANKYFFLNVTINDANGVADFVNATVEINGTLILKWDNATNTFSEYSDPNNYCTLDAAGSLRTNLNTTAHKLSWKIKLTWTYAEGSIYIISTNTKVYDSDGESGSGATTSLFTFEDDLIVSSASVDDSRVNPSQTITFTGHLCYQGTSTPPEDVGGITAKVSLGETVKGSTSTINSTGHFQITFNAETGFQLYSYTVYAVTDENTVQNQTVDVIVDRLIVTIAANTTNPAPYSYVSFAVAAIYDYDDSPVTSWTVNIYRNSTHFATGNFTDGGYAEALYLYTTENVTENVYGLTGFTSNTATVYWSTYVALTIQTKDLDNNILTDAIVYFNETEVPVDSQGYAIKTDIVQYNVLAVKVKWQGCWVNGTWTVNMTETKTIEATCNVWSLLVIARDSELTLFTSANLQLYWTAPNASSNLLATSDGTWTFKTANGTSYYMVKFFDVWVTSNTSIAMSNKNVTVLYVNCNAYPFTMGSAKYHWASNATATSYTWNDTSLMLQILFDSSPDYYTLVADSPRPTYVLNVSYSMSTCYTTYLSLTHYGNATLTLSYENWGDFYIRSVDHKLTSASWAGQVLTLTIEGEPGENGTLTVYCGSRGGPRQQQGLTSATYNADTKILSGLYVFASQVTVTLDWTTSEGGQTGGRTTIGTLQVTIEDVSLSLSKGKTETFNLTIHWSGVNDISITKVTITEEYVTWFSLTETLPKYASKTSADAEGIATVTLKISVPWQTTTGQHSIPVTVSVQQQGGITVEKSAVIYLTITSGAPSPAGIPEIMTYLFLAMVLGLSAYAFIKKR